MTNTNIFPLAQIITAAGTAPSDVTDAVWAAGYRRPEKHAEQEVMLALQQLKGLISLQVPSHAWPVTLDQVKQDELNEIIEEALWGKRTATQLAMILVNQFQYSRVVINGAA
ncbi:hypothetical protein CIG19_18790 [Enterobacterales bacterium CwR94]|nr:hypothetical protein CIG19_18790 [Enterobacterales bacterium CwR94]